jgi:hypothetical protein
MIYTGVIEFQGTLYDGEHETIVDTAIWQKVSDIILRKTGIRPASGPPGP